MNSEWKFVLDEEALNFLLACRSAERKILFRAFADLKQTPSQTGDYEEKDDVGRPVQVKLFGRFFVTYWSDSFVKELRIIEIERVRSAF